jgi:predicted nucleic acid-binding protein
VELVDSDILTAHLRGVTAARDWLEYARRDTGPLAISAISIAEVADGMRSAERREVNRLLAAMQRIRSASRSRGVPRASCAPTGALTRGSAWVTT